MRVFALLTRENRYSFSPIISAAKGKIKILDSLSQLNKGDVLLFSFQSTEFERVHDLLKKIPKWVIKIAGGPHATGLPLHALHMGFDFVFAGEAEEYILDLLGFLEGKKEPPPCLWWKDHPGTICKGVEIEKYAPFSENLPIPIEITRGCPFLCAYCQTPRIFGRKMRHRSAENIIFWVEKLVNRGIKDIRFITPNGLAYGGRGGANSDGVIYLFQELGRRFPGANFYFGSFPSEFRPEHITFELLKELRKYLANERIIFGAQSGSEETLRLLKRGHRISHIIEATEATIKAGFRPEVDFIFGLPFEDEKQTLDLMKRLAEMGARIHAHYFLPLPATPLAREKPRPIGKILARSIEKLTGEGRLFGQWKKQQELSLKLYKINMDFS